MSLFSRALDEILTGDSLWSPWRRVSDYNGCVECALATTVHSLRGFETEGCLNLTTLVHTSTWSRPNEFSNEVNFVGKNRAPLDDFWRPLAAGNTTILGIEVTHWERTVSSPIAKAATVDVSSRASG